MIYFYLSNIIFLVSSGLIFKSAFSQWLRQPALSTRLMAAGSGMLFIGILSDDMLYILSWMFTPGFLFGDSPVGSIGYYYSLLTVDSHVLTGVTLLGLFLFSLGYTGVMGMNQEKGEDLKVPDTMNDD